MYKSIFKYSQINIKTKYKTKYKSKINIKTINNTNNV